jgi:hypothetical protein
MENERMHPKAVLHTALQDASVLLKNFVVFLISFSFMI